MDTEGPSYKLSLAFELDGKWIRLSSADRWTRAIRDGDIKRSSLLEVEHDGVVVERIVAGRFEQLKPIFDEYDPLPRIPDRSSHTARSDVTLTPQDTKSDFSPKAASVSLPAPVTPATDRQASSDTTRQSKADPAEPYANAGKAASSSTTPKAGCAWVFWAIILLGGLFLLAKCADTPRQALEAQRDVYVRIGGPTFTSATRETQAPESLGRGTMLTVASIKGQSGVASIVSGRAAGRYVDEKLLTDTMPPELSTTVDANWEIGRKGAYARVAPSNTSQSVGIFKPGTSLYIAGITGSGWAEVVQGDKVSYVYASLFHQVGARKRRR